MCETEKKIQISLQSRKRNCADVSKKYLYEKHVEI